MSPGFSEDDASPSIDPWQVIAVRYGTWPATRSGLFYDWALYDEDDDRQALDFYFWILRRGERTIVVDTGFGLDEAEDRGRSVIWSPREALRELAPEPDAVVLTHLHYDHTGNIDLYPEVPLLVSTKEADFWQSEIASRVQFAGHAGQADLRLIRKRLEDGSVTLFEAGAEIADGVITVDLPGHTPGQIGLRVETSNGPVLLTSDAVHLDEELESEMPFRLVTDLEALYQSFQLVKAEQRTGTIIVPGHEPMVIGRFPPLPGFEGRACLIA